MPHPPAADRPVSTYRIQLRKEFGFAAATAAVPYLHGLGISHCYASPYLAAVPGSSHGYDVIDPGRLNPDLGTMEEYHEWIAAMRHHGMAHIVDIVPNHVGVATNDNRWWNDVLEHGPASPFASYFDIAWDGPPRPGMRGKVLLPILGRPYAEELEAGHLVLERQPDGKSAVRYFQRIIPISAQTAAEVVDVADYNGQAGDARSFDRLDELLSRQHYRLAYWLVAADEINYRRFFAVNDLAALSMERPEVFDATHNFILSLVNDGAVAGLRVDHPDGLADPGQYFQRLARRSERMYTLAEKILAFDEELPQDWPVDGTSGYDFLNRTNGLFVDPSAERALTDLYQDFTGEMRSFAELCYVNKRLVLGMLFAGDLQMLARRLDDLARQDRRSRDFTLRGLRIALREIIACFGVYRAYITPDCLTETDRAQVRRAVEAAIERNPRLPPAHLLFVRDVLLREGLAAGRDPAELGQFAIRFQQLTSPTTAKGVEDTSFYQYNRLISLNEVGGDPSRFGIAPDELHGWYRDRQQRWPASMSTLSTHDTKRSEDVRARINAISELPDQWGRAVRRWRELNASRRDHPADAPDANEEYLLYQTLAGAWPMEGDADQYADFAARIDAYMLKAIREAKVHTSWPNPDPVHEEAVQRFVRRILDPVGGADFLAEFLPLQRKIAHFGAINSLAQTLLKITAPGMPDTYQGTEGWDLSLVDPDNRREVDFGKLAGMLAGLNNPDGQTGRSLVTTPVHQRLKLFLTAAALRCRRDNADLFAHGAYLPLAVNGRAAAHVFAFARRLPSGRTALVAVPRLSARLVRGRLDFPLGEDVWEDTHIDLPGNLPALTNVFTGVPIVAGEKLALASALESFPVLLAV